MVMEMSFTLMKTSNEMPGQMIKKKLDDVCLLDVQKISARQQENKSIDSRSMLVYLVLRIHTRPPHRNKTWHTLE